MNNNDMIKLVKLFENQQVKTSTQPTQIQIEDTTLEDTLSKKYANFKDLHEKHKDKPITELSTELLGKYKTAASAAASAADAKGDFKTGDKRFSGIVKATKKQFANDAKASKEKTNEQGVSEATDKKAKQIAALKKKIDAANDSLGLAREQRRMKGQRQQGPREIALAKKISELNQAIHAINTTKDVTEATLWSSADQKMKHHSEFSHTHTAAKDIHSSMSGEVIVPKGARLSALGNDNYLNLDTGVQPFKLRSENLVRQGVTEGKTSHAELAQAAHKAYIEATRQGNSTMAAHYAKEHVKHKKLAANEKKKQSQKVTESNDDNELDEAALGKDKMADLRAAHDRHMEKALAANKAGNDEETKFHQQKMQMIKSKMVKLKQNEEVELELSELGLAINEDESTLNPTDSVTMDIPLVMRMLEYAREDASTDMDLHHVVEKMIELGKDGHTLSMQDYNSIVEIQTEQIVSELGATGSAISSVAQAQTLSPTTKPAATTQQTQANASPTTTATSSSPTTKPATSSTAQPAGNAPPLKPDEQAALDKIMTNAGLKGQLQQLMQKAKTVPGA